MVIRASVSPNTDYLGVAALHYAVRAGDLAKARNLISNNWACLTVLDSSGAQPLHVAAETGKKEMAALLLRSGAPIDAKNRSGQTPLQLAIINDSSALVELLLDKGADFNIANNLGWYPIHQASESKLITAFLLAYGADVNLKGGLGDKVDGGRTALHWAAEDGNVEVVEVLLANGADPTIQDFRSMTPLELSRKGGKEETTNLLENPDPREGLRVIPRTAGGTGVFVQEMRLLYAPQFPWMLGMRSQAEAIRNWTT